MISTEALIAKFQQALDEKWGYIWGGSGDLWTERDQKNLINAFVKKYGTSWEKNSEAKDDDKYRSARYGSKWIGRKVADCSGLFKWAFNCLKESIAHGSNTIYLDYCNNKGRLSNGRRQDGKTLQPGTAVFVYNEKKRNHYTHIGLYIGHGKVIEAQGVDAGVCVSNVSASKWTYWGELKKVSYDKGIGDAAYTGGQGIGDAAVYVPDQGIGDAAVYVPQQGIGDAAVQTPDQNFGMPSSTGWMPTVRKGSKGQDVQAAQTMLYNLGYDIGRYGIDGDFGKATEAAVKEFQRDNQLKQDGVVGPLTWDALQKAAGKPAKTELRYTVCIKHLDKTQADAIRANYPGSIITEE